MLKTEKTGEHWLRIALVQLRRFTFFTPEPNGVGEGVYGISRVLRRRRRRRNNVSV